MEPCILAIDLGSTHFKGAVFSLSLEVLGRSAWRVEYGGDSGGCVELAADAAEAGFRNVITGALLDAGVTSSRLVAIAVTSQAQTFTILDQAEKARLPLISWQDGRAGATCAAMCASPEFAGFAAHASFGALQPNLQICQLAHLRDHDPAMLNADDRVAPLLSLLIRQLTDGLWIDENLAAMSGLYSLRLGDWWPPALARCGVTASQLPCVRPIGSPAARTDERARRFGLGAGIPIVLAGNDQTAGAYGARLHENGAVLLTLGTAQVAYMVCDAPCTPGAGLIAGPYPGGRWYLMAADLYGGNLIEWACRRIRGLDSFESFFTSAAESMAGDGIIFKPDDAEISGTWSGNSASRARPGAMARAVLDCLVERLAQMLDGLAETRHRSLLAAGGGSRHPVWPELLSRRLGRPVMPIEGDPLAGAAAMALENIKGAKPCADC